jgi:flagellar motor switch protein FliM
LFSAVGDAKLELKVVLGKVQIPLGRFTELRPGEVFFFRKPEHVRVLIGDIPLFEAQIGRTGASKAIRIDRSVAPPKD